MRNLRIRLAQWLLPSGLTTTGTGEQEKLVNALRDALREKDRHAVLAARAEGRYSQCHAEQEKLVNALRDALREKDRLADVAARFEGELAELKKR